MGPERHKSQVEAELNASLESIHDIDRIALATASRDPGVLAAGKYLRAHYKRNWIVDEHGDESIAFPHLIIEGVRRRKFLKVTGLEAPEGESAKDAAPTLARNLIDANCLPPIN